MIGKHLKEYKKQIKKKRLSMPHKFRLFKNCDWRKRWMPFIKYDHDFDSRFFLDLIIYKLHILLDFYEQGKYCMQAEEGRLQIVDSLKEACRLGDLLIDDNFDSAALKIIGEHCHHKFIPVNDQWSELEITWDDSKYEEEYHKLSEQANIEREETKQKFFKYLADHYEEWWD